MKEQVDAHALLHEIFWSIKDRQEKTELALSEFGHEYTSRRDTVTIDGTTHLYPIRPSQ